VPLVANLVSVHRDRVGRRLAVAGVAIGPDRAACAADRRLLASRCHGGQASPAPSSGSRVWATVGGACCGTFTGVVFAEVSARVEDSQRGRALGWVMTGQSLTLVVGVPLAAYVGSHDRLARLELCMAAGRCVASSPVRTVGAVGTAGHGARRPRCGARCRAP
jgi:MFS family permease